LIVLFSVAAFSGAALLFILELMFSRMVLPLMGGTASVWTTCLLFYQVVLLAGYAYSHILPGALGLRRHALLHIALLLFSLLLLPVGVRQELGLPSSEHPVAWLLVLLTASIGLPFLLVSSTAPLLQRWLAATDRPEGVDPYFLYAASNGGSLLALLLYPTVLEPALRLGTQARAWSLGYTILGGLLAICAGWALRGRLAGRSHLATDVPAPGRSAASRNGDRLRWTALALVPSSLLLGITTYLTADIAAVPLLWVVPLVVYLLTFILTFARRPLLPHSAMLRVQPILAVPLIVFLFWGAYLTSPRLMPFHLATFFVTAMVCHGQLARTRPPAGRLTEFYLCIALGGALGGAFNVLIAPLLFTTVLEYPLMLVAACALRPPSGMGPPGAGVRRLRLATLLAADALLVLVAILFQRGFGFDLGPDGLGIGGAVVITCLVAVLCYAERGRALRLAGALGSVVLAAGVVRALRPDIVLAGRNFYGTHEVMDGRHGVRYLLHGTTIHGAQITESARRREPTSYYSRQGPLGDVFRALPQNQGRQVAVIGLGTGSAAAYAQAGERWIFYEIDPAMERIARDRRLFTFLDDAPGKTETRLGDGRLLMDREPPAAFDVIVLDAFSSDATPVHLLTVEAISLYLEKLKPNGLVLFHLSNRFLDLEPVVAGLARELQLEGRVRRDLLLTPDRARRGENGSIWAAVTRPGRLPAALDGTATWVDLGTIRRIAPWRDDYSSIIGLFRRP
jgi:SAM-dependent methyltransferase